MLVRLMTAKNQTSSPITPDLNRLVVLLGRYFQIRDDYMNLTSVEVSANYIMHTHAKPKTNMIIVHGPKRIL